MRKIPHLLMALMLFLGVPAQEAQAEQVIVPVRLIAQKANNWCWATTLQMTVLHTGTVVSQCSQANARFARADCCNVPTPALCDVGGWPDYARVNYNSAKTATGTALTFEQLKTEFRAGRPVNFSWGWPGGGGHIMVANGFSDEGGAQLVWISDPGPADLGQGGGSGRVITYAEYVSAANHHVHWIDYSGISSQLAERYYTLKGKQSGLLLNVEGASTIADAKLIQAAAAGADQEKWTFTVTADGYLRLKNKKSGMVAHVPGNSTSQGTKIVQWPVSNVENEKWGIEPTLDGYFAFRGRKSGLLLNVEGGSTNAGANIVQWPQSNTDNEKWKIE